MTAVSVQESLRHLTSLSHFSLGDLERLARAAQVLNVPSGQIVVSHGDSGSHLYGLTRGALSIQRSTPQGDFVLARLKAGEFIGEANFVDPHERSTDVVTEDECELVKFDPELLREQCAEDRRFELALYWAVWHSASRRLRITTRMLGHFFSSNVAGDAPTSVGEPSKGVGVAVDVHTKRDFFLEQDLSHMEANFLASLSEGRLLHSGDTIFREGEKGEQLFFVLSGEVRISKAIPGAGEEALAILERGDIFGEMALVDKRPRTADAVAHEGDVELLVIPAGVFSRILDVDKLSSARLLKLLCRTVAKRLRTLDDKIVGWYMLSGGESTMLDRSHDMTQI